MKSRLKIVLLVGVLTSAWALWPAPEQSQSSFQKLSSRLSEVPGYFDTDNLISNEASFQHVVPMIRRHVEPGGIYLGVGPGQNFTYIAHTRPDLAFIIDIRRDNLLLLSYFKALFESSENRWVYLSRLLGKPLSEDLRADSRADAASLVSFFRRQESDRSFFERVFEEQWQRIRSFFPETVNSRDRTTVHRMVDEFFTSNFDLRFRSHRRSPRRHYPTLQDLIMETDGLYHRRHYLETEQDFAFLREMQLENRIIPVIGDLAGDKAVKAVGRYVRDLGGKISVFYLSNVEFYLFGYGSYSQYLDNMRGLPWAEGAVLLRSYFGYSFRHPQNRPGYYDTSVAQFADDFFKGQIARPYQDYWELILGDHLPGPVRKQKQ